MEGIPSYRIIPKSKPIMKKPQKKEPKKHTASISYQPLNHLESKHSSIIKKDLSHDQGVPSQMIPNASALLDDMLINSSKDLRSQLSNLLSARTNQRIQNIKYNYMNRLKETSQKSSLSPRKSEGLP